MKHLLLVFGFGLSLTSLSSFAMPSYKVTVNGMVCSFCAQGIEKKMKALSETKDVYVGLKNHLVVVEVKDGLTLSQDTIRKIIKGAGYEVKSIELSEHPIEHIKSGMDK
ncbi:MAG: heavy-metal-associated domain-containing protein [Candidatus Methylopumilus sp.]|nr:heavy-metal-associated domain-containing protein [Candidatus Methylopumilus sp.]